MAIARKQIGWSQESNLLWEISRQMEKLTGVAFNGGGGGGVQSVTGLDTDNTDPLNPIVQISVDGTTITGDGTPGNPLVSAGGSGTVYTDGLTIGGDGASGTPLKTLMPVVSNISLASASYDASTEGVYEVTTGTDPLNPFYFNFPDASVVANQGKRFIIVNKDATGLNVDTSTFNIRGTSLTSNSVPPGESYEFVSVLLGASIWTWVCINCSLYRSYVALIIQGGPNPPIETVLENTIGPLTWAYDATGVYSLNSTGIPFTVGKTTVSIGPSDSGISSGPFFAEYDSSSGPGIIQFKSYDPLTLALTDGYFAGSLIEIRVYY